MKHNPVTIFHEGDWSALYIDGKLEYVGDTYLMWEHLETHYEWDVRQTDDFFKPNMTQNRANVFQTLEELHEGWRLEKIRLNEERIADLEAERAELDYEIERLRELAQ